ncbi:MAG: hypothetical protein QF619_10975 [Candidatus Binatia bacterium]|nr:hypothetical protein [Candidatus Binatia bacterium]
MLAIDQVLKGYDFSLKDIERWVGKIVCVPNPRSQERKEHLQVGGVVAVFDEGIKNWGDEALRRCMRFLSVKGQVLTQLEGLGSR